MTRLWLAALAAAAANAAVTVYRPDDRSAALTATTSADAASYTGAAAYDPTVLTPPPVPQQFQRDYVVQLMQGGVDGLSIPHTGNYLGFSIELSVANRAIGTNSSVIAVPFLNHMQNVVNRAGSVRVRVGGNTQERALLLPNGFPDGSKAILKKTAESDTTTVTPHVEFTPELIQMLANVAQLIKTEMFLGLNFMDNITDPQNQALFAGMAQKMIGSSLKGIALGNEPDLYAGENHGKRPAPYTFDQYFNEWGTVANALTTNPDYTNRNILMGPSTCCRSSNPEFNNDAMAEAGYLTRFNSELGIITVQRYPTNNCGITPRTAQEEYPDFLSHALLSQHAAEYETFSRTVQAAGKPLYMFETNTAACGGFPGISDSFGAGLWATDWALKLATYNFSSTLLHVGGQGDYYNPFTPPPTNQSTFRQWTTGSVYYSTLIVAEFFGKSGKSQVIDLNANGGENLTPAYAVYEEGVPTRVLFINYVDDPSGAHDAIARIAIGGGTTGQPAGNPASVRVKYFAAPSVSFKGNMTWAGQTLGNHFESDGRLQGTEDVQTIQCDAASNTCAIPLKAPSLALVFLTDAAYQNSAPAEGATVSFETSVLTRVRHTATIDQAVLATSNGRGGSQGNPLGSTSFGSVGGAATMGVPGMGVLVGLAAGAVAVVMGLRW